MKRTIYTVHSLDDPALASLTPSQAIAYGKHREGLPPIDGEPVKFSFRRLTRAQLFEFVESTNVDMRKMERAFMASVIRIEGGHFGAAWEPDGSDARAYVAMTEDELAHLEERGLSIASFVDVGQVAYVRSLLSPKAEPLYPLPPSSLLAWDALPRPSAEPSPAEAHQSSAEPSAALA